MKNTTKRKDNRWQARKLINGQRYCFYGKTQLEANNKLKEFIQNFKKKKNIKINLSLYDWYNEWFETYKSRFVSIDTAKQILNVINLHLKKYHNLDISEITSEWLQKYLNTLKPSRAKERIVLYLNACFKKAVELGKLKLNPFAGVVLDKKIKTKKKCFTYEEQQKIWERLKNEKIKPIIMIYLFTGLRKKELEPKRIFENIDFETKILKAKNEKQRSTDPVYKYIDLSDEFISYIKENRETIESRSIEKVYRKFFDILKELNIEGSIHTLRHTFATNQFYLGTPDKVISEWLGHSTIQITKDIYTNLDRTITKEKLHKLYNNLYYEF